MPNYIRSYKGCLLSPTNGYDLSGLVNVVVLSKEALLSVSKRQLGYTLSEVPLDLTIVEFFGLTSVRRLMLASATYRLRMHCRWRG